MNALLENNGSSVSHAYDAYLQSNQEAELQHLELRYEMFLHDYTTEMNFARAIGKAQGKMEAILTKRFRIVPEAIQERIFAITDLDRLEYLADFAFECESLEDFSESMK